MGTLPRWVVCTVAAIVAFESGGVDRRSPDLTEAIGGTTFQVWYSEQRDSAILKFDHDVIVNGNSLPAGEYALNLNKQGDASVRIDFLNLMQEEMLQLAVRSEASENRDQFRIAFEEVANGIEPAAINDKLPPEPSNAQVALEKAGRKAHLRLVMTGLRRRSTPAPDIPPHLADPWSIVKASLDALLEENVEKHMKDFADDLTSDLVFGEGVEAHKRFLDGSKKRGVLEGALLALDELEWRERDGTVVFTGSDVFVGDYSMPFTYEVERRGDEWKVTRLGLN